MDRIKDIASKLVETPEWPDFRAGDTISVTIKIIEGSKERLQKFQGVVIQRRGIGTTENIYRTQNGLRDWCRTGISRMLTID